VIVAVCAVTANRQTKTIIATHQVQCTLALTNMLLITAVIVATVTVRDKTGSVSGNTYYNYGYASVSDPVEGDELIGRQIKSCVGSPPPDALDKSTTNTNLVIDDGRTSVKEVSKQCVNSYCCTHIKCLLHASCLVDTCDCFVRDEAHTYTTVSGRCSVNSACCSSQHCAILLAATTHSTAVCYYRKCYHAYTLLHIILHIHANIRITN
jgi:hypothetical protein